MYKFQLATNNLFPQGRDYYGLYFDKMVQELAGEKLLRCKWKHCQNKRKTLNCRKG